MLNRNMDIGNVDFNELNKYFSEYIEGIDFDNIQQKMDVNNNDNEVNNQENDVLQNDICQNCGCDKFIEDHCQGIIICTNKACGEVLKSLYDNAPEWKQYDDDDKSGARCSQAVNVLLPQSSLGTSIGGFGRNRIKVLHSWNVMPSKERSLNKEFKKIHEVCQKEGILKCVEDDIKIMYKMVSECKHVTGKHKGDFVITRGVNRTSIIAACMSFACIRKSMTYTPKEIAKMWCIKEMDINKGCKNLQKLFKIKNKSRHIKNAMSSMATGTTKPEHFIKRYCNELKIKNQYIDEALKIAINVEKLNLASGHTPFSSAAASILLMAELNNLNYITKNKLANEFEISGATIYKTYKELEPYKNILTSFETTDQIVNQIKKDIVDQKIPPEVLARMQKFGVNEKSKSSDSLMSLKEIDLVSIKQEKVPDSNYTSLSFEDSYDYDSSLELEEDENYDFEESNEFEDIEDESDEDLNFTENFSENLKEKFASINKLLKTKTSKDMKKDMKLLLKSSELVKQLTRDLDKYSLKLKKM